MVLPCDDELYPQNNPILREITTMMDNFNIIQNCKRSLNFKIIQNRKKSPQKIHEHLMLVEQRYINFF